MTDRPPTGLGSWTIRRRFLFVTVGFCMAIISYAVWRDSASTVTESAVTMSYFCIMSAVGAYVFGATWEDVQTRKIFGTRSTSETTTKTTDTNTQGQTRTEEVSQTGTKPPLDFLRKNS